MSNATWSPRVAIDWQRQPLHAVIVKDGIINVFVVAHIVFVAAAVAVATIAALGRLRLEGAPSFWTAAMDHSAAAVHTSNERYVVMFHRTGCSVSLPLSTVSSPLRLRTTWAVSVAVTLFARVRPGPTGCPPVGFRYRLAPTGRPLAFLCFQGRLKRNHLPFCLFGFLSSDVSLHIMFTNQQVSLLFSVLRCQ